MNKIFADVEKIYLSSKSLLGSTIESNRLKSVRELLVCTCVFVKEPQRGHSWAQQNPDVWMDTLFHYSSNTPSFWIQNWISPEPKMTP